MGLEAPSPASLARILAPQGARARSEPRKRPRSAWRRFVYPAPNACWQLDATEYVLAGGRKAVIFQLQDDHCRLAVASPVAPGETSDAAIAVFDKGVAAHGVPQRLLTDNGAAHGPQPTGTRRTPGGARAGPRGRAPRRQGPTNPPPTGDNERFGQTLLRYLDKQPPAESIADLQARVDAFDHTLQHPAPPPGPARAPRPAPGVGRHPRRRPAPTRPSARRARPDDPQAAGPLQDPAAR